MAGGKLYTDIERATIKKYAGKKTAEEIGAILGRSRSSVLFYARKHNISLRQVGENHHKSVLSNLQVQMAWALKDAGFTASEIHKACLSHASKMSVYDALECRTHRGSIV